MGSNLGKLVAVVVIALLVVISISIQDRKEIRAEVGKLWSMHGAVESAAYELGAYIHNEDIPGAECYYDHFSNLVNKAVTASKTASRKEFSEVKTAIASDVTLQHQFAEHLRKFKAALNEERSYARWAPALDRIRQYRSKPGPPDSPLPVHLPDAKVLIWDFSVFGPTGTWHSAMLKLPLERRARSLKDNPIILVLESETTERVGEYVSTDGIASRGSPTPAFTKRATVSLFGNEGSDYLGSEMLSSRAPPATLKTFANMPLYTSFITDDIVADVILRYLPKQSKTGEARSTTEVPK